MCSVLPFLGCWIVLDCNPFANVPPFGLGCSRIFFDLHRTFFVRAGVLRGGYPQQKTRDLPCPSLLFCPVGCLSLRVKGDGERGSATVNQNEKEKTKQIDIDTTAMQSDFRVFFDNPHGVCTRTPCMKKPPRKAMKPTKGAGVKEDDKRLSSWCWSRSRVASLHSPLSSPTVLFQRVTQCNLHPCHIARCGVEFVGVLHQLEILLIGELD